MILVTQCGCAFFFKHEKNTPPCNSFSNCQTHFCLLASFKQNAWAVGRDVGHTVTYRVVVTKNDEENLIQNHSQISIISMFDPLPKKKSM